MLRPGCVAHRIQERFGAAVLLAGTERRGVAHLSATKLVMARIKHFEPGKIKCLIVICTGCENESRTIQNLKNDMGPVERMPWGRFNVKRMPAVDGSRPI
jgi:hypothetical protein